MTKGLPSTTRTEGTPAGFGVRRGEQSLSAVAAQRPAHCRRWWTYQRERFPLLAHGPLIAAFSLSAVSYSFLLRGESGSPSPRVFLAAFITSFLFFLQLRIADEFKDFEEDSRFRPYRPVPRGLVTLWELGVIGALGACVQLGLALWVSPAMILLLLVVWAYLALMTREFFVRRWIKAHPFTYMWTHMLIIPLVDFYATAWDWLVVGSPAPPGLLWFLTVSFCNGVVLEIGRKIRAPSEEEEGVETYTVLWGQGNAVLAWLAALLLTAFCAWRAALAIQFAAPVVGLLAALLCLAVIAAWLFICQPVTRRARRLEYVSALWTLVMYLSLGVGALTAARLWAS